MAQGPALTHEQKREFERLCVLFAESCARVFPRLEGEFRQGITVRITTDAGKTLSTRVSDRAPAPVNGNGKAHG
jgi:hypothetical protein